MTKGGQSRGDIIRADRARVWHPYTSIDEWEKTEPIVVTRAAGVKFWDANGTEYFDGNSSWWVASLGHSHPRLVKTLSEQAGTLAHCALAGIAHEPAARLAEELIAVAPKGLERVFYTDNGSTSVEVAIKIAIQYWQQHKTRAAKKKTRFVALDGAFHGDTIGATALGGVDVFRRPFADVVFDCVHAPFPEEHAYARAFETITKMIQDGRDSIAAVIVEPIVQGAAGMRIYEPRFLSELRKVATDNDVLLILDEVFAGYGRTGKMWASDHARITPDIMCLGKAFSSMIPMGATLVTEDVFSAFRGGKENALYYGHTFCGNPLGAALAREVLRIYEDERIVEGVAKKAPLIQAALARVAELPGVERVRSVGMIGAADLSASSSNYFGSAGWTVYEEAKKRGAYLRPLGDTVYVSPPLVISDNDLKTLLEIFEESVRAATAPR